MRRLVTATVILGLLMIGIGAARARGPSTISLNGSNPVEFESQVTFSASTDRTDRPWATARCYRGGTLVYQETHGMFDGYYRDPVFTLGPTRLWQGGGAECDATLSLLHNGRWKRLATTTFVVQDT